MRFRYNKYFKFIDKEQQNLKAAKSKTNNSNLVPRPPVRGNSGRFLDFLWCSNFLWGQLRQVSGIKYLNQMSTYHLACGDSEIT